MTEAPNRGAGGEGSWSAAGAVAGVAVGLLDGMRAIGPGYISGWRAAAALVLAPLCYGAAGALSLWLLSRVLGGTAAGQSRWRPPEASSVGTALLRLVTSSLGLGLAGLVAFNLAESLLPSVGWRIRALGAGGAALLVGCLGYRWLRRRALTHSSLTWVGAVLAAVLAVVAGLSGNDLALLLERAPSEPSPQGLAPAIRDRPNVVLIVLDTTRADHLSLYGYPRETTPFLSRLARSSSVYERAIAPSPWTIPSHASLFTGLLPSFHRTTCERRRLTDNRTTLAEILRDEGYATVGFSCNAWVGPAFGLDQGFQRFFEVWRAPPLLARDPVQRLLVVALLETLLGEPRPHDKGAATLNTLARDWLDGWQQTRPERPFYLFINYVEAHLPYDPPEPYRSRFVEGALRERLAELQGDNWLREVFRRMGVPESMSGEDYAQLADLYDAGLAYQDAMLQQLVEDLERRGLLDNTLLVVAGDHGENLGEHGGLLDHCFSVHQTTLSVPLVVRYPPAFPAGLRHHDPVSLVNVFSSILDVAGVTRDEAGAALPPPLPRGRDEPGPGFVISEYGLPVFELSLLATEVPGVDIRRHAVRQRAIQDSRWKLVDRSDGTRLLFDLERDPLEQHSLDLSDVEAASGLMEALSTWMETLPVHSPEEPDVGLPLDESTREALQALGYVSP